MDKTTLLIYAAMYVYGFALTVWAIFFHKYRTPVTRRVATVGLIGLLLTLFYVTYILWTFGIR